MAKATKQQNVGRDHEGPRALMITIEVAPGVAANEYTVRLHSPVGNASATMRSFPLPDPLLCHHLDIALKEIPRSGSSYQIYQEWKPVMQDLGCRFFQALLPEGDMLTYFNRSLVRATREEKWLRIRFKIEVPAIAALPLEYLFDESRHDFLCMLPKISLIRTLTQTQSIQPIKVTPPLHVLVFGSNPSDQETLGIEREKLVFERAFGPLINQGLVKLKWMEGTWERLKEELERETWHVFHLIGHGIFRDGQGCIAMSDEKGKTHLISAEQLGIVLEKHHSLRLVLLNFCEGGKSNSRDLFSSTAAMLALKGIPVVLGMQTDISDDAAITLTRWFYSELIRNKPVDVALASARHQIVTEANLNTLEWGTPVLYLSSNETVIFTLREQVVGSASGPESQPVLRHIDVPEEAALSAMNTQEPGSAGQGLFRTTPVAVSAIPSKPAQDLASQLADCEAASRSNPSNLDAVWRWLELLQTLSCYDEALAACTELICWWEINAPVVPGRLYTEKGKAHLKRGEYDLASQAFEKARALGYAC